MRTVFLVEVTTGVDIERCSAFEKWSRQHSKAQRDSILSAANVIRCVARVASGSVCSTPLYKCHRYSAFQGDQTEAEVLLFPGIKLVVEGAMDMGNGLFQVHLRELPTPQLIR